jgi:hypothetical protein
MKELRDKLLDEIALRLKPEGFRKSEQTFARDFNGGRWFFHVAFIPHKADFDTTADVSVRHDAVERALHAGNSLTSEREKKKTATIGAELGNLRGTGQHRWTVRGERDVVPVVKSMLEILSEVGYPFLQRFSSLGETRRVLSEDSAFSRLICPFPDKRARVIELIAQNAV